MKGKSRKETSEILKVVLNLEDKCVENKEYLRSKTTSKKDHFYWMVGTGCENNEIINKSHGY